MSTIKGACPSSLIFEHVSVVRSVFTCFSYDAGGPVVQSGQQGGANQHYYAAAGQQPPHPGDVPFFLQSLCATSPLSHCGRQADFYSTSNPQT
jgi:hypothetical protein